MVKMNEMQLNAGCCHAEEKRWIRIGTGSAMLSAFLFGFNPLQAKIAYAGGSNAIAMILYAAVFATVLLVPVMAGLKIRIWPERKEILPILVTGFFGSVRALLLFTAYNYVATGIATTLHFTYPTFVAVGSVFILKQKLTKYRLTALGLSLLGICLAADFSGEAGILGILLAIASGVTYALYILLMDKTGLKDMNFIRMSFYMGITKAGIAWIYGAAVGALNVRLTPLAWGMTLLEGLTGHVIAGALFQVGVKYTGASNAAIFSMLEPVTSLVIGFLFMSENLTPIKIIGCLLILSGIVITTAEDRIS